MHLRLVTAAARVSSSESTLVTPLLRLAKLIQTALEYSQCGPFVRAFRAALLDTP